MNTYQLEKTHSGVSLLPLDTVCFEQGVLFLEGSINEETATRFIQNGMILAKKQIPITVVINSNGGELLAGLNIYDFLTSLQDVTTIALKAFSMGSLLFAAGKKRVMLPHSRLMLHEPLLASGVSGSCTTVETATDQLKAERELVIGLYAKHTGMSVGEIRKVMKKDTYFTAEQAKAFGLSDGTVSWNDVLKGDVNYA